MTDYRHGGFVMMSVVHIDGNACLAIFGNIFYGKRQQGREVKMLLTTAQDCFGTVIAQGLLQTLIV